MSSPAPPPPSSPHPKATSGVPGLDAVLRGGWPKERLLLVLGHPGAGKTTLGLQFLRAGAALGEKVLYVSLSESAEEVMQVAASHGWSLEGVRLYELDAVKEAMGLGEERSMFDPSDVQLRETSRAIVGEIERIRPDRVVFDSLAELEMMAGSALVFRRELLVLKRLLMEVGTTALLMSDSSAPDAELEIQSLVHGIVELQHLTPEYGGDRRRLRVRKLRGTTFRGGHHDFRIERGGVRVYPRLEAAEGDAVPRAEPLRSGLPALDSLLGPGLGRGTSTLIMGPAGAGKTVLMARLAAATLAQGEKAVLFLFEESSRAFLSRAEALGMPLSGYLADGQLELVRVNPAELSPGEFSHRVREFVEQKGVGFIGIDSLNGYVYAMPEERFLTLHIHELLSYLGAAGVVTVMVMAQHGVVGSRMESPADVTYVADALILLRFFEAAGRVRRGISVLKNRTGLHETTIRELELGEQGLVVGEPLVEFDGILSGIPSYVGHNSQLIGAPADED